MRERYGRIGSALGAVRETSDMSAKPKKVLVVDDSQLVHRLYELAFGEYPGCQLELHLAANGYDGLEKLKDQL